MKEGCITSVGERCVTAISVKCDIYTEKLCILCMEMNVSSEINQHSEGRATKVQYDQLEGNSLENKPPGRYVYASCVTGVYNLASLFLARSIKRVP